MRGGGAHATLKQAVADLNPPWRTLQKPGMHSVWQLVEHMRIAQEDLLRYTTDAGWQSPKFPEGYWTEKNSDLNEERWQQALQGFHSDLAELIALAENPEVDLTAPLPHAPEHSVLRQLLLAADHNAYHTGQIISIRKTLGMW